MRRVIGTLVVVAFVFAASACALDAPEDNPGQDSAEPNPTGAESAELEAAGPLSDGKEPPITPSCGTIFRADGCAWEHQSCSCSNTGWAGYCAWETDLCNWYIYCHCD